MQPTPDECIKLDKCIRQDKRSKPNNDNKSPQELNQATDFTAMELLWKEAQDKDQMYKALLGVATRAEHTLPEAYRHLRISPSDLSAEAGVLRWRERDWVPDSEPLCTGLIQEIHDSYLAGHPGKNVVIGLMACRYFWPGMTDNVKQFVRNCHACGRNTVWRDRRKAYCTLYQYQREFGQRSQWTMLPSYQRLYKGIGIFLSLQIA
jgi:hypothetical protein